VLILFVLVTAGTMFAVQASVTLVTAGLAGYVFGTGLSSFQWSAVILAICAGLLVTGRYRALDRTMKGIMGLLGVLTLLAVVLAVLGGPQGDPSHLRPSLWTTGGITFVIALMGWMPIPLDVAVWHSLWTLERASDSGHRPSVRHAVTDFNLGYLAATLMAVMFLVLGATVMYGTGEPAPEGGVAFAARLIELFGRSLGGWSSGIIAGAALVTMFSTTLAVTDGFPRVIGAVAREMGFVQERRWQLGGMGVVLGGALLILSVMADRFTQMIDVATTLSFVTTPLLAIFNLWLLTGKHTPEGAHPPRWLVLWGWGGALALLGFGLLFVIWRLSAP
jgi:Mn2+/Fe2+ NRAMP family transporter